MRSNEILHELAYLAWTDCLVESFVDLHLRVLYVHSIPLSIVELSDMKKAIQELRLEKKKDRGQVKNPAQV